MTFKPKFFYDAAADNTGTGGDNTDTAILENTGEQQQQNPPAEIPKPFISEEEAKNYGFDSQDALKNFLAEHKAKATEESITPEQKKEQENIEKANLLKFAADKKLLSVEEYTQYETIKSKTDQDLVFDNFKKEFAADNPEITDAAELEEAAQEEFRYQYKLNDPKAAARSEKIFAKEAKELRTPVESKVIEAQEQYKQNENIRQTYPKFESFVEESIKRNTPDKLAVVKIKVGEAEIPVEIELTKEDREDIAKTFKTAKTFQLYTSAKPEEITQAIDKKMQGWIKENKSVAIAEASFKLGQGTGMARGSNVGANNPFPLVNNHYVQHTGEETLEESNKKLGEIRAKYAPPK